jgi:hypothetical protein
LSYFVLQRVKKEPRKWIVEPAWNGYWIKYNKKHSRKEYYPAPYSTIKYCPLCGHIINKNKGITTTTHYKRYFEQHDAPKWNNREYPVWEYICFPCFNKIKPLIKMYEAAKKIPALIVKLRKKQKEVFYENPS